MRSAFSQLERVGAYPFPADCALTGAHKDRLKLPKRAVRQRAALVPPTALVAVVFTTGAVLDGAAALAVGAAGAQLLVEGVQDLAVDPAELQITEQRPDVVAG